MSISTKPSGRAAAKFSVAYVITSTGRDIYADMGVLSALSVRISNPGRPILLVCDQQTSAALNRLRHPLPGLCDQVKAVSVPEGHPTFRNRILKTTLCRHVEGACLYLDADTLVRGSLLELPEMVEDIGAVLNENAKTPEKTVFPGDREFLGKMGWSHDPARYVNGGVQFFHATEGTRRFYEAWNRLYLEGLETHLRQRPGAEKDNSPLNLFWQDQPSLNAAIIQSGVRLTVLPDSLNFQLQAGMKGAPEALVWHFWAAMELRETIFFRLLDQVPRWGLGALERRVRRAIRQPYPYLNQDCFGRKIGRKIEHGKKVGTFESLWLKDRRAAAVRFWLGSVKARLMQKLRERG